MGNSSPTYVDGLSGAKRKWTLSTSSLGWIYFESIDLMVNAIEQRFDQPSFAAYAKMGSLLVKALNSQDSSRELQFMEISYTDDVDVGMLTAQLEILKVLPKAGVFYVLTTS